MIAVRAASDGAVLGGVCGTVDGVGPEAVFLLRDVNLGPSAIVVVGNLACRPVIADPLMSAPATTADLTGRSVGVGCGRG